MLGDLGTVRDRQSHGTPERPAAGWYADLADGTEVYLGDYAMLAAAAITKLKSAAHA